VRTAHAARVKPLVGEPWVTIEVLGRRHRVSAESFFQVNTVGAAALIEIVAAYADPRPGNVLLDAYCGSPLRLALADLVDEVIGVESSLRRARISLQRWGQANVSLHEGTVEDVLPALISKASAPTSSCWTHRAPVPDHA